MSRPYAESDTFRAVADPTRRRLLALLLKKPATVGELLQQVKTTGPNLSHHLRILRQSGMISQKRRGRFRVHQIHCPRLRVLDVWLKEFRPL